MASVAATSVATTPWVARLLSHPSFVAREPSHVSREQAVLTPRIAALAIDDPALFLERYGDLCTEEELAAHFSSEDYEVRWHLTRLRRTAQEASQTVRNRRFRCMQELERDGEFFSDHSVQLRAPQLFHDYVGKLLPAPNFDEQTPLSERLLANFDHDCLRSQPEAGALRGGGGAS